MKFFSVGSLIFLLTVVQSFPFPRPTGPDFPPFSPVDSFFGDSESRAHSDASAFSSGKGNDGPRKFGIGCHGNPGFPDGPDGYDMPGGGFHKEHGDGGGPPFMMGDGFDESSMAEADASAQGGGGGSPFMMGDGSDVSSMAEADASAQGGGGGPPFMMGNGFDGSSMAGANANAEAGANAGSTFLGSGTLGSAAATANSAAVIDAGPKSAQSVAQTKSGAVSTGNGVISSATSFSSSSAT